MNIKQTLELMYGNVRQTYELAESLGGEVAGLGAESSVRIRTGINATTVSRDYWTRSYGIGSSDSICSVDTSGRISNGSYSVGGRYLVGACNFIGES